jgi:hypothetical protein
MTILAQESQMPDTLPRDSIEGDSALRTANTSPRRELPREAQRALAEAAARRDAAGKPAKLAAKELNGPKGAEPTRYGDWEIKGIASDF